MLTRLFIAALALAAASTVSAQSPFSCPMASAQLGNAVGMCNVLPSTVCVVSGTEENAYVTEGLQLTYCPSSNQVCSFPEDSLDGGPSGSAGAASLAYGNSGYLYDVHGGGSAAEYSLYQSTPFTATTITPNTFAYDGVSKIMLNLVVALDDHVSPTVVNRTYTQTNGYTFQLVGNGQTGATNTGITFNTNIPASATGSNPVGVTYTQTAPVSTLTVSNVCTATIVGDPQFVGLRGQSFQVHGVDGGIYNLVSSARTQVNAQFVFLSEGECPVVDGVKATNCWSHPGSYLGAVSVQQVMADGSVEKLVLTAGSAKQGFASLELNGKALKVGDSFAKDVFSVSYDSTHLISVKTEQFSFTFDNSDMFINQAVGASVPLSKINAHGLLGQTSDAKIYSTPLRYIAGEVDDYLVSSSDMFGSDFMYNKFSASS